MPSEDAIETGAAHRYEGGDRRGIPASDPTRHLQKRCRQRD
jgi:hypothetical protein